MKKILSSLAVVLLLAISLNPVARAEHEVSGFAAGTTMLVGVGLLMGATSWVAIVGAAPEAYLAAAVGLSSLALSETVDSYKLNGKMIHEDAAGFLLGEEMTPVLQEIIDDVRSRAGNAAVSDRDIAQLIVAY